jgi:hypothetical protein
MSTTDNLSRAVLCFSSVYYNLTDANQQGTQSTAQSSTTVLAPNGRSVITNVHLDTGGSQNLASEQLLHKVKKSELRPQPDIHGSSKRE